MKMVEILLLTVGALLTVLATDPWSSLSNGLTERDTGMGKINDEINTNSIYLKPQRLYRGSVCENHNPLRKHLICYCFFYWVSKSAWLSLGSPRCLPSLRQTRRYLVLGPGAELSSSPWSFGCRSKALSGSVHSGLVSTGV